ncbi:hypothetical protein AUP68_10175 [Ilyonectria robusta]
MSFHGTGPLPILIGGWTLTGIAAGVIIARLYLRIKIQSRRLLLSDIFMVAAWFCGCACNSISIVLMRLGALDPSVGTDLKGFTGNPDNISKILKVKGSHDRIGMEFLVHHAHPRVSSFSWSLGPSIRLGKFQGKPITPEKPLALLTTDNRWTADSMAMTSVSSNRPDQNIWDEDRTDNNSKVDLMQVRPIEDVV